MTNFIYTHTGLFAAALSNRYGCRAVCITGSVLSCCGLILSSFAQSINVLILTYGLVTGKVCHLVAYNNKTIRDGKYLARHMPVLGNFHPITIEILYIFHDVISVLALVFIFLIDRATQEVPMQNI